MSSPISSLAAIDDESAMQAGPSPNPRPQTEHRRRRLHQLLEREARKSPDRIRASKSLPSLMIQQQRPLSTTAPCPSPVLTKCTPNLSPLRAERRRPATRQLTARTARAGQVQVNQEEASPVGEATDDAHAQITHEAALARHVEEWEKRHRRLAARQCKVAQLEQICEKQQRRHDRKLEAQEVSEQIAWDHAQLELVDHTRRLARQTQLLELRESQLHSLELDRRQAGAAKIMQHFFDRLAVMEPAPAFETFVAKHTELVACCMELMEECVERHELEQFKEMLRETLHKEELLLRHRLRAAQREEEVKVAKKQAVVDLKRAQFDEIQRHVTTTRQDKAEQRVLRTEIIHQQQLLDSRYRCLQDRKKQREVDLGTKLQEQIRRHRAEQATVSLHIEGMASPVLRTPFWSDESIEARVDTYERAGPTAISPGKPTIFAKKACQWYD